MQRTDSVLRWVGVVGLVLGPFCFFVLPSMMAWNDYQTAEEQQRAIAAGGESYAPLISQITGSFFMLLAAVGLGGFVLRRPRGRVLAVIGLVLGVVGGAGGLVVVGMELSAFYFLGAASVSTTDALVEIGLALNVWPVLTVFYASAFFGALLSLPILGFALWRNRRIPLIGPLLYFVIPALWLVPIQSPLLFWISNGLVSVLAIWMAVQLMRWTSDDDSTIPADAVPAAQAGTPT